MDTGEALARARLDELLRHVGERVSDVLESEERVRSLLDAVMAIASDLDLRGVLRRITESACHLVSAQYGALLLTNPERRIEEFITHGITDEEAHLIGPLPECKGILALLVDDPRPMRLTNVGEHPAAYGFPPHHPVMTSMLAIPILLRDDVLGVLYLTNKANEAPFTEQDEEIVSAIAAAAGVAIENARLYDQERMRQQWLSAASEINQLLVHDVDRDEALRLVCRRVRELTHADFTAVSLLDHEDPDGGLVLQTVDGMGMESTMGEPMRRKSLVGSVIDSGTPLVVEDVTSDPRFNPASSVWAERLGEIQRAMFMPLASPAEVLGVLIVGWRRRLVPPESDTQLVAGFAAQAALALQRVRDQQHRERLLLFEDRDRIARDLHDVVIQRLFATGMRLQTAEQLASQPAVRERLTEAIDALDQTTRDIRSTIFQLRRTGADSSVRESLHREMEAARDLLGFPPRLEVRGPVDVAVPPDLHDELVAVVRELLSNVARHASPSRVDVLVSVGDGGLVVQVSDDGVGVFEGQPLSGLRNLADRAERAGGGCSVEPGASGGITVDWRVPLPR